MARITDEDVQGIIEVDTSISLTPFITIANELVTELCSGSDYTDDRLALIETWLAAHFYAVRDPRTKAEKVDVLSESFEGQTGMNLSFTRYGQQAMLLDTKGSLAKLNASSKKGKLTKPLIAYIGD